MALNKIYGRNVVLRVTRDVSGTLTKILVGCITDMGIDIDRDSEEATCTASGEAKEFVPGQYGWTASPNLNVRQATGADAATNVTAENFIDLTLSGEIIDVEFDMGNTVAGTGNAVDSARYAGQCFITKASLKGQQKGIATFATTLQGTGELVKVP
jgi:hypothetical protein